MCDARPDSSTSTPPVMLKSINRVVLHLLKQCLHDSQERQGRSLATLQQAFASLKVCPVPFTDVEDLKQLYGFESNALRGRIQRMLSEWCGKHGRRLPIAQGRITMAETGDVNAAHSTSKIASDPTPSNLGSKNDARSRQDDQPKAKKTATPKQYVPQPRTGSSGILIALYSMTAAPPIEADVDEQDDQLSYHAKSAIITHAQPYCDAKYVPKQTPSHFSKGPVSFHSAWSGMKTLINRGYVYRRGNPARFGLSALGWQVAEMCASKEAVRGGCRSSYRDLADEAGDAEEDTSRAADAKSKAGRSGKRRAEEAAHVDNSEQPPAPFHYAFLTDARPAEVVTSRSQADMRLSDTDFCLRLRIVFRASQSEHVFATRCIESVEPYEIASSAPLLVGWVKENVCNAEAPGLPMESAPKRRSLSPRQDDEASVLPQQARKASAAAPKKKRDAPPQKTKSSNRTTVQAKKAKARPRRRDSVSSDFLDTTSSSANEEEEGDDGKDPWRVGSIRTAFKEAPFARVDNLIDRRRAAPSGPCKMATSKAVGVSTAIDLIGSSSDTEPPRQHRLSASVVHDADYCATKSKARAPQAEPVWISSDVDVPDAQRDDDVLASPSHHVNRARNRAHR